MICVQVDVDDVKRTSEHQVAADHNHQEGANACNRLLDQPDEESCLVKQAKPIENLQPQEEYGEG